MDNSLFQEKKFLSLKRAGFKGNLISILLFFIVIRPIIDLFGRYEGNGLNWGGAIGFFVSFIGIFMIILRKLENGKVYYFPFYFFLIALTYFLSFCINGIREDSIVSFGRYITGFSAMFILIFPLKYDIKISKIILTYLLVTLIPIFISWLQYVGLYDYSYYDYVDGAPFGRPSGGYIQPNSLTRLLLFSIILTYILYNKEKINTFFKYSYIIMASFTIFISGHRTSLIILLLILFFFEVKLNFNKFAKYIPIYLSVGGIVISVLMFTLKDKLQDYISIYSLIFTGIFDNSGKINVRGRGVYWEKIFEVLKNNDVNQWLFGHGYSQYEAHNDILRMIVVNGLIGTVAYIGLFAYMYMFVKKRIDIFGKKVLNISFLYLILFAMPLHPTEYPHFMWMFFFTLFSLMILYPKEKEFRQY